MDSGFRPVGVCLLGDEIRRGDFGAAPRVLTDSGLTS